MTGGRSAGATGGRRADSAGASRRPRSRFTHVDTPWDSGSRPSRWSPRRPCCASTPRVVPSPRRRQHAAGRPGAGAVLRHSRRDARGGARAPHVGVPRSATRGGGPLQDRFPLRRRPPRYAQTLLPQGFRRTTWVSRPVEGAQGAHINGCGAVLAATLPYVQSVRVGADNTFERVVPAWGSVLALARNLSARPWVVAQGVALDPDQPVARDLPLDEARAYLAVGAMTGALGYGDDLTSLSDDRRALLVEPWFTALRETSPALPARALDASETRAAPFSPLHRRPRGPLARTPARAHADHLRAHHRPRGRTGCCCTATQTRGPCGSLAGVTASRGSWSRAHRCEPMARTGS